MKTLPKITIQKGGTDAYEERKIETPEGKVSVERHYLTTGYLIRTLIENTQYKNAKDQHEAFKIYDKLNEDDAEIELEDSEFSLIQNMAKDFKPFLQGVTFMPFYKLLEYAVDASKK